MNAQQAANIAVADVLIPLQKLSPHEPFVLGGYSALAVEGRALKEHGHNLGVMGLLERAAVPPELAPIIAHLPARFTEEQIVYHQRIYAEGADHGNSSRELQPPFSTSKFIQDVHTPRGVARVPCNLKLMSLPIDPPAFDRLVNIVRIGSQHAHYLTWPAIVVEQLILAADTNDLEGERAAFMFVRWACRLGREEILSANARPGPHPAHRPTSVTAAIAETITAILHTEEGDAVIHVWLQRVREMPAEEAAGWEWTNVPRVQTHYALEGLVEDYTNPIDTFKVILQNAHNNHPRREFDSLAKTAFQPGSRRRGERAATFV